MIALHTFLLCFFPFGIVLASNLCSPGWGRNRNGTCQICGPGHFDNGHGYCDQCDIDEYQPDYGQTQCKDCPPNTNSYFGASTCLSCSEGQLLLTNNTCGVCPAGMYVSVQRQILGSCIPCSSGFFKAEDGFGPCLPCPRDTFSADGASRCVSCPEGQALMQDGSCRSCPPGTNYDYRFLGCPPCRPGTFTASPNRQRLCNLCTGNSFAPEGSSECYECPLDMVFMLSSRTCGKCPAGQMYNSERLLCEPCPLNHFSTYENERECTRCAPRSFARPESSTCFACPPGLSYIVQTDRCGECSEEDYDEATARCGSG